MATIDWVALKDDEVTVISSGKTLDETANRAEKKGFKNPIFFRFQNIHYLLLVNEI